MKKKYFPMFVDISGKRIVIVGGGRIAQRRAETLLEFVECSSDLTVISPALSPGLERLVQEGRIWYRQQKLDIDRVHFGVLEGAQIVLAATDDQTLNREIVSWCRAHNILVNTADDQNLCDFYFPSVTEIDGITVALNSGGRNPGKVKALREKLEEVFEKGKAAIR